MFCGKRASKSFTFPGYNVTNISKFDVSDRPCKQSNGKLGGGEKSQLVVLENTKKLVGQSWIFVVNKL